MGLLSQFVASLAERRASLENPSTSLSSVNWPGDGIRTAAGTTVTEEKALALSAVWRAVRLCTQDIASMPFLLYSRKERGKERALGHPLYTLLHDRPNPEMSSHIYWETVQGHIELWGNHYSEIQYRGDGSVAALWPLMPDRTWPERKNGEKVYHTRLPSGETKTLSDARVFHVPGFGFDGLVGKSPIALAREALGFHLAVREYGARYFGNGARSSGVLMHPEHIGPEALQSIRNDWERLHSGLDNSHRIAILEEGVTYQQISISPEDSQFLETQRFGIQDVARWFGVPLHMLADNSMSPASNVEQASLDWVMHGIRPRAVRIEKAVNWDIVPQGKLFAEFLLVSLLRGDMAARGQFYNTMFNLGAMSQNDIREAENMNAIENGDTYYVPLNMIPSQFAMLPPEPAPAPSVPAEEEEDEPAEPKEPAPTRNRKVQLRQRLAKQYQVLFRDAATRALSRELIAARRARAKGPQGFASWREEFYPKHRDYLAGVFLPVLNAYGSSAADCTGMDLDVDGLATLAASDAAERWVEVSNADIAEALAADSNASALDDCLASWEQGRAAAVALDEMEHAADRFLTMNASRRSAGEPFHITVNVPPPTALPAPVVNVDNRPRPKRMAQIVRDTAGNVIRIEEMEAA